MLIGGVAGFDQLHDFLQPEPFRAALLRDVPGQGIMGEFENILLGIAENSPRFQLPQGGVDQRGVEA